MKYKLLDEMKICANRKSESSFAGSPNMESALITVLPDLVQNLSTYIPRCGSDSNTCPFTFKMKRNKKITGKVILFFIELNDLVS